MICVHLPRSIASTNWWFSTQLCLSWLYTCRADCNRLQPIIKIIILSCLRSVFAYTEESLGFQTPSPHWGWDTKIQNKNYSPVRFKECIFLMKRIVSARQHICYSALYMLSPVRSFVRPSLCLVCGSVRLVCLLHGWISQKLLKLRSCNFHYDCSFLTVNFAAKFQRKHKDRGAKCMREG